MQNAKIDNYLKILLNQPLLAIGRASNMLWVGFGKEIECTNFRGQKVKKSSIALHVQSSWRIIDTKQKEIIVAQSDFYFPNRLLKEMVEFICAESVVALVIALFFSNIPSNGLFILLNITSFFGYTFMFHIAVEVTINQIFQSNT